MTKEEVLEKYFGYQTFRDGQEKVIDALLCQKDALAVMPTGAGKSVCFQIPAIMLPGVTIVISPLISLMKDQVGSLSIHKINAAYINNSLTEKQIELTLKQTSQGKYKLLYVAPERLQNSNFLSLCRRIRISLICVDEAHCVSQWGKDFRPAYLSIKDFIDFLPERPVVCAVTATASRQVRADIIKLLKLQNPDITVLSFDRKNLFFSVATPKDKYEALCRYLNLYINKSGIIYCSSRKSVEAVCSRLIKDGYNAVKYHAGMAAHERKLNQDLFIKATKSIIVATNAFGMGIDKPDVSFVIHYNMPGDIESYYQEAGRAGRNGKEAHCVLFYDNKDIQIQRYFIEKSEDNISLTQKERNLLKEERLSRLEAMIEYSKGKVCLRNYILSYFGEKTDKHCYNCSVCCNTHESFLSTDIEEDIIKEENTLNLKKYGASKSEYDKQLITRLMKVRSDIAVSKHIPKIFVCTYSNIKLMSRYKPEDKSQLIEFTKMSEHKADLYGALFIREINSLLEKK